MARKPNPGGSAAPAIHPYGASGANKPSIIRLYWIGLLLLATVPMLALGYFWVADQYAGFREQSASLRQSYLDRQAQSLRREAQAVLEYLAFKNGEIDQRLADDLKTTVNTAIAALSPVDASVAERERQRRRAREVAARIAKKAGSFAGDSDHLFLLDADGTVLLFPIDPDRIGRAAVASRDDAGAPYLQMALQQARAQGESLISAWLPKPAGGPSAFSTQVYLRYFPALGLYVGAIGYVEDRVQTTQREVLARYRAAGSDEVMVSIVDYAGNVVLGSRDVIAAGAAVGTLRDADGQALAPLLQAAQQQPQGVLIRSRWRQSDGGRGTYLQINQARAYPNWRWIVITGFALHELDAMLEQQQAALKQRVQRRIAYVGLAVAGLLLLATLFAQHLSSRTGRALRQFNRAFEESSRSNTPIDVAQLPLREFDRLAIDANRMLEYRVGIEQQLVSARIAAESANQAKSQFLSTMSHELRTPLNGVLGYAQILMRDPQLTPEQHRHLCAIENCGKHLLTLINDILDLAKIESGALAIQPSDCNLHRLVQAVADIARGKAETKGLAFRLEMEGLPEHVWLDEMKLRQVLLNLLGNAVKFTESGSIVLSARLSAAAAQLVFVVADTGIGISRQRLQEIFQPFRQNHHHAGGSGLGLAISERVSHAMGGDLTAESALGAGSRFTLLLPYVPAAVPVVEPAPTEYRLNLAAPVQLMVVDDNAANRSVLASLLRGLGCVVVEAENGLEALVKLRTHAVPLVFMDVRMAVMDGIETTRRIKQDPALQHIIVIAVSASVFPEVVEQMRAVGCDDFINKPVQFAELTAKLSQHLQIALQPAASGAPAASAARLDPLPAELQQVLRTAIAEGDLEAMYSALHTAEHKQNLSRELVQRIRALLDNFDLEAVRDLLAPTPAP